MYDNEKIETHTHHEAPFPYEEIRSRNGDYFVDVYEAKLCGYKETQIWSVVESEGYFTYGPSFHYVNVLGYIATKEHHDEKTYYHEDTNEED